jgi:hypothetical protein
MKTLIAGLVLLTSGILIHPYLIPLGLTVATAAIGEMVQKSGKKNSGKYTSMYFKGSTKRRRFWH